MILRVSPTHRGCGKTSELVVVVVAVVMVMVVVVVVVVVMVVVGVVVVDPPAKRQVRARLATVRAV